VGQIRAKRDGTRLPEFGSGLRARLPGVEGDASAGEIVEPRPAGRTHHLGDATAEERSRLESWLSVAVPDDVAPLRSVMRHQVDDHADELWTVFAEALSATTDSGKPDHRVRLLAARSLLAEVYGQTPASVIAGKASDELAALRARRRLSS
jgi:hypothetical protein